jgi:protein-tyrosine phosphatase
MIERHIPLDGTPNLRDLGGYQSRCGRKIKHGKLFRSGSLAYLSNSDWSTLNNKNLGIICDFRHDDERKNEATRLPDHMPTRIIHLDINAGNHMEFIRQAIEIGSEQHQVIPQLMRDINRMFAMDYTKTYREFLSHVSALTNEQSLLFHCSAGKDRTGFAAALLMMCLNIDRDTIKQDYMLTSDYYKPEVEIPNIIERWSALDPETHDAYRLAPMLEVRPEYLDAAFNAIDKHYGSTEAYLDNGLAIDKETIAKLQESLLE